MTRPNITPGPWRESHSNINAISHGQWFKLAKADCKHLTDAGNYANARAIAAVPALLEALEDLHRLASIQLNQSATMDGLVNCDAIAKARSALIAAGYQF